MPMEYSRRRRRNPAWSDLPPETIEKICKNLKTRNDILHFRQTCRKWQKHSKLPCKILSPILPLSITCLPFRNSKDPFILQVSSIYLLTLKQTPSQMPCMIMVEEHKPGKIILRHALTGKRVRNTPRFFDVVKLRVYELSAGCNFKNADFLHKVVSRSDDGSSLVEVMVMSYEGSLGKVSVVDDVCKWSHLKRPKTKSFVYVDDVVTFKGMCCVVDRKGKLYELSSEEMSVKGLLVADQLNRSKKLSNRRKRLVVDTVSTELYLVE